MFDTLKALNIGKKTIKNKYLNLTQKENLKSHWSEKTYFYIICFKSKLWIFFLKTANSNYLITSVPSFSIQFGVSITNAKIYFIFIEYDTFK